jgi:ATP-binding cassette subfamily B multidrug efflux pump
MKSLQRMIHYIRPYRWIALMGLLTVILPVAMELVVPRMLQIVIDQGIRAGEMTIITHGSLIMLGAALVGAVATLGQGVFRAQLSQGMAFDMRNDLFTHIQALSFANLDRMQTGRLMTRLSSDVDLVRLFSSGGLSLMLRALLMIIGSVIMMFITDWQLSLVTLGLLLVAGLLIRGVMGAARPLFTVVQQKLSALNTIVQESLAGVQVVKAFVREKYEIDRFTEQNVDYMEQNIRVGRLIAVTLPLLTLLTNIGLVAVIWWGGLQVIGGRLSLGELIGFNNYLVIGMTPLLLLGNMMTMVSRAEASAARILEVLDTEPLIRTAARSHSAKMVQGRVIFDQVFFHYNTGNGQTDKAYHDEDEFYDPNEAIHQPTSGDENGTGREAVLDGVSFVAEPGQRIALLGATGSGKSTLVNLIPRFYDVTGGRILVDGVDVREWAPDLLRSRVGMVLQQTTLFSGTVRENIAYGRPKATFEEVIEAAQAAQAHDFIMAMPQGYDSIVEARGANLSGGQRQRIAIARALLISPSILILDDSTSSVDLETEIRIQEALDSLMVGRTTFIIAQRINSVLSADQILVLESGRIAAQGTHHELMQNSTIYREIYRSQLGENGLNGQGSAVQRPS